MFRDVLVYLSMVIVFGCLFGALMVAYLADATLVVGGLAMVITWLCGKVYRGDLD